MERHFFYIATANQSKGLKQQWEPKAKTDKLLETREKERERVAIASD